jgi:4-amino-4-deoxy-L-arabinose transferase-like glycosyltransferase
MNASSVGLSPVTSGRLRPARALNALVGVGRSRRAMLFVCLTAVVGVAVFLRVYSLDRIGFNSDEAVYAGQAASISGSRRFLTYFPIYRAHPLLYQAILSLVYHAVVSDFAARLVSVAFGVGAVLVTYALGSFLYDRRTALFGSALLAAMPYHVIVSRQALLDGPEVFFATLALYALARYRVTPSRSWMLALAGSLGLTFLTKETAALLLGSVFAYLALDPDVRVKIGDLIAGGLLFGAMAFVYPLSIAFGGTVHNGGAFLLWQLLRSPNHGYGFYAGSVAPALGILVIVAALAGLLFLRRRRSWRETLLLTWIGVPVVFFELWPVKGYEYLLTIAPPVVLLAGRALASLSRLRTSAHAWQRVARVVVIGVVAASVVVPSWSGINATPQHVLAGAGGLPGGREAGRWVSNNIPVGAQMMAIGASMANVLEFYGNRKVWGLSISTNPHDRNPVYQPVPNPDLVIRQGVIQYLVWDAYSASRSSRSSVRLMRYVHKYHGRVIHTERAGTPGRDVIQIFEVRP